MGQGFRADFDEETGAVVGALIEVHRWLTVLVELKTVEQLLPIHHAHVVTYLRLANLPVGLLVNMNERTLRQGLRRLKPSW